MAKPFYVFAPVSKQTDNSGLLVTAGARRFVYLAGTTTKATIYGTQADAVAGTNAIANPVVADSSGTYGAIWATQACKTIDYPPGTDDPPTSTAYSNSTRDNLTGLGQVVTSKSKTGTYTVTTSDRDVLIKCDATGGSFTINLLAASSAGDGFNVKIKKIDSSANTVTIAPNGTDNIEGVNSSVLLYNQNDTFDLYSDSTQWLQQGSYNITKGGFSRFLGAGSVFYTSTGTWTQTRNAQGDYSYNKTAGANAPVIAIDITDHINTNASKGFKLSSFDVVYSIGTTNLNSHSVTLNKTSYANNVAVSTAAVTTSGTLATATQANPYVSTITVSTPAFNNTADSHYFIEVTLNAASGTIYNFYGVNLKFSRNDL